MQLHNRTAIVTGASMGIGAATATTLAKKGVTVWAVARSADRLAQLAAGSANIRPFAADITVEADRVRLLEATGPVDILVNNAGLGTFGMVETMSEPDVRHLFELNVMALIDLTQKLLPDMLRNGSGHICNVGSSISYMSGPPLTVYAATKYAVHGFTDGLRREVFHRGVGVSLIQPGPVKTAFWDRAMGGDRPGVDEKAGGGVPAQWVATSIYKAIRFDRVPGFATVAVPRPLGLGRLLDLPGVSYAIDMAGLLRPQVPLPMVSKEGEADVIPIRSKNS